MHNEILVVRWRDVVAAESWNKWPDPKEEITYNNLHISVGFLLKKDKKYTWLTDCYRVGQEDVGNVWKIPNAIIEHSTTYRAPEYI